MHGFCKGYDSDCVCPPDVVARREAVRASRAKLRAEQDRFTAYLEEWKTDTLGDAGP